MSSSGLSPQTPNKYLGPNVYLNVVVMRNRAPTGADYRQPETGKLYPIDCYWIVGKDPTTGIEGDLWYLSKIVANVGYWLMLSTGSSGPLLMVDVDVATPPGVDPTTSDGAGLMGIHGASVANHSVPIETHARALNSFNVEVQYSDDSFVADATKSGLSHFDSSKFSVDPNTGYVTTSIGSTRNTSIVGAGTTLSNATPSNLAQFTLTPGVWMIQATAEIKPNAVTGTYFELTVSTTSATRGLLVETGAATPYPPTAAASVTLTGPIIITPNFIVNTTFYTVAYAEFTAGTVNLWSKIVAVKISN